MEGALGGAGAALKVIGHVVAEAAEAALQPLGGDEHIDQGARFGSGGLEAVVIFHDEKFESRGVFAGDDLGFGVNAGFQGVEADGGLALRCRAGATYPARPLSKRGRGGRGT